MEYFLMDSETIEALTTRGRLQRYEESPNMYDPEVLACQHQFNEDFRDEKECWTYNRLEVWLPIESILQLNGLSAGLRERLEAARRAADSDGYLECWIGCRGHVNDFKSDVFDPTDWFFERRKVVPGKTAEKLLQEAAVPPVKKRPKSLCYSEELRERNLFPFCRNEMKTEEECMDIIYKYQLEKNEVQEGMFYRCDFQTDKEINTTFLKIARCTHLKFTAPNCFHPD